MQHEIEAKFLGIDKDATREKLKAAGFALEKAEYMMRRKTFDLPAQLGTQKWGRVRQESDKVTMTVKEIRGEGIQDTYETEIVVNDFDAAAALFEACGFPAKSFQENFRETWTRDGVEATIDTWPGLKPLVEIEGPTEEIVRAVTAELGLDFAQAMFGDVFPVYEKELGIPVDELKQRKEFTFADPPQKRAV